jgi:Family of unknown function (DUF6788)
VTRKQLEQRRAQLVRQAPKLEYLLRGTLFERTRRCGRPTCHCAVGEGHRTSYVGVTLAAGKVEQVTIPGELLPVASEWTENYKRLWTLIEEVSAINRELLRRRLLVGEDGRTDGSPSRKKAGKKAGG